MTLQKRASHVAHRIARDAGIGIVAGALGLSAVPALGQATPCEMSKLQGHDTALRDAFGSVAVDGNVLVVGAINHGNTNGGSDGYGAAYVFEFDGSQWVEMAKLLPSDIATNDEFGHVAIFGDTIVVGSSHDDDGGMDSGSAYVFVKPADGWDPQPGDGMPAMLSETAKLTASDPAPGELFGTTAIFGDTIAVGALNDDGKTGGVYVFEKPVGGWTTMTETIKLTASNPPPAGDNRFGVSLAIEGHTLVVGADQLNGAGPGAAYVFERQGNSWVETATFTAFDGVIGDRFGFAVDVRGRLIVVGAFTDEVAGDAERGSAYLFERSAGGWTTMTETAKLTASAGDAFDQLGASVAILDCDTIFVGTHAQRFTTTSPGYVCAYKRPAGGWVDNTETYNEQASDGVVGDQFGQLIDVSCDTLVVGAPQNDDEGDGSGSAYVFAGISGADYDGNGVPDVCDALCPWDRDGDGIVGITDFLTLLGEWGACP